MINSIKQSSKVIKQLKDYDHILENIGDAQIVMIGEASHGTYAKHDCLQLLLIHTLM
jgi:erythromycin esterase-like protein